MRLSSEYMHLMSQRHSKTFLEKARFSSRWTLAEKISARKVIIWQQYFIAIPSRRANPVNGLAQKSAWHDLKQGPLRSRSDFWQNECTWKPLDLGKRKKLKEKKQFLPNFWNVGIKFHNLRYSLENAKKDTNLLHEIYKAPRQCSQVLDRQYYQVRSKSFRLLTMFRQLNLRGELFSGTLFTRTVPESVPSSIGKKSNDRKRLTIKPKFVDRFCYYFDQLALTFSNNILWRKN